MWKQHTNNFYISYNNTENLKVGNKVEVWIDGVVNTLNPGQAEPKKVEVKE